MIGSNNQEQVFKIDQTESSQMERQLRKHESSRFHVSAKDGGWICWRTAELTLVSFTFGHLKSLVLNKLINIFNLWFNSYEKSLLFVLWMSDNSCIYQKFMLIGLLSPESNWEILARFLRQRHHLLSWALEILNGLFFPVLWTCLAILSSISSENFSLSIIAWANLIIYERILGIAVERRLFSARRETLEDEK